MARITAISDWYWSWMHEYCQNEKSLCGRFNHQLQASLDKEANEKTGRDLFERQARLPGTAARLTLEKRKEHKKSRDPRQSHIPPASERTKKRNRQEQLPEHGRREEDTTENQSHRLIIRSDNKRGLMIEQKYSVQSLYGILFVIFFDLMLQGCCTNLFHLFHTCSKPWNRLMFCKSDCQICVPLFHPNYTLFIKTKKNCVYILGFQINGKARAF